MTSTDVDANEAEICGNFMKDILAEQNIDSPSPLKSLCFCMTYDEVEGEVIDVLNRYLHDINCPRILVAPLIHMVKTKFLLKDLDSYQLESQKENDIKEYECASVTKELYRTFVETCLELSNDLAALKLKKTTQNCHVSLHSIKNKRRKMEDRHIFYEDFNGLFHLAKASCSQSLYAVFDGHGGTDAANYAASQFPCKLKLQEDLVSNPGVAIRNALVCTDEDFILKAKRERLRSGSTAVVVLIQDRNLTVAWLGDSQVVLCKDGNAIQLMEAHKPDRQDERDRVEALGGCVVFFGGWRVNGQLSVSRAIGDYEQRPYITNEPDVEEYELEGDEEFVIVGCDGLWDTVEPFDAVETVRECLDNGTRDEAAEILVELAKKKKSMDNITVMVVYFDFNNTQSNGTTSESKLK